MNLEKILNSGKNLFRKILLASAVTAASLITAACPIVPPPNPGTPNALGGSTVVLTEEETEAISRVTDNEIYFSQPVSYSTGDIIASDITDSTPYGFLREVTGISADKKIVYTEQASLEQAVEDADFSFNTSLSSTGARFVGQRGISVAPREVSDPAFHLIFDEVVLLDLDDIPNNGNEIVANGEITFNIDVSIGAKIEHFNLKKLEFRVDIPETANLTVGTSENFGAINAQATLGEFRIPAFTIGYIPLFPPPLVLPLIVKPRLEIIAKINGGVSQVAVGVTQDATVSVGLLYENSRWSPIAEFTNSFEFIPPTFSDVLSFKASVGPKLAFRLYDVAGPYGELNGFLRFDYDTGTSDWALHGGLEATLGADMRIFKKVLLDYSAKVLDEEWLLASGSGSGQQPEPPTPPPEPPQTTETVTIQPGPEGKDAYVKSLWFPDGHYNYYGYGDTEILKLHEEGFPGESSQSLIQFPLDLIPSNATITSAKLKLYTYAFQNIIGDSPTVYLSKLTSPWNESTVRGDTKPSKTQISTLDLTNNIRSWYEFDITSLTQNWINGQQTNYGLEISTKYDVYSEIYSSDNFDFSKRPILEVNYTIP